jgi:gamma-polyglutamate biosynthesis protein CapA
MLAKCDAVIGNLECVLTSDVADMSDLEGNEMRGRAGDAMTLRQFGFNVLSVANNHMMQHGKRAFNETLASLQAANIQAVGLRSESGESNVVVLSKNDCRVAVIAYSLRPENYVALRDCEYAHAGPEVIVRQVRKLKAEFDAVVVCLHWGEEYLLLPSPDQVQFARRLSENGATIVAGHHPHVLQGMERIGSTVVFYSLGNFVFDSWRERERESVIAMVTLEKEQIVDVAVEPVRIGPNFVVLPCKGDERVERLDRWKAQCDALESSAEADPDQYARTAEREYLRYRASSYLYFLRNAYRFPPTILAQSIVRALRRRVGLA